MPLNKNSNYYVIIGYHGNDNQTVVRTQSLASGLVLISCKNYSVTPFLRDNFLHFKRKLYNYLKQFYGAHFFLQLQKGQLF